MPRPKGLKHSKKSKIKMSEIAISRGFGKWSTGKKHSEETKIKMKENHAHFWKGKKQSPELIAKRIVRGIKHWNWQGGITPLVHQIRICFKSRQWKSDVFMRDDYTCVLCGIRSGNGKAIILNADHHPKLFSEIFHDNKITSLEQALNCEEFWNINNGRTLCRECHKKFGRYN
jgi:hypothetical protein